MTEKHLKKIIILGIFFFKIAFVKAVEMPHQDQIFSVATYTISTNNYISCNYIFSALPFYKRLPAKENPPWAKYAHDQRGVIVLKDKSVLFFTTQDAHYLEIFDFENHTSAYYLPKLPSKRKKCPQFDMDINDLPFPTPENVFCVATFPWNKSSNYTSQSLIEALPSFHPSSAYPKSWQNASRENKPLNGVLVLKSRAVLKWFAWDSSAIVFENYRVNTYFVRDKK
ncbi:MAG: hypothetical protein K1X66_00685 [Verrucomicrobiae bacterium]|nr:hypothetical protein [Verrucomicrobiae bacterium]